VHGRVRDEERFAEFLFKIRMIRDQAFALAVIRNHRDEKAHFDRALMQP
jgi:hypothetical protein